MAKSDNRDTWCITVESYLEEMKLSRRMLHYYFKIKVS
jgi:hypothetical protein